MVLVSVVLVSCLVTVLVRDVVSGSGGGKGTGSFGVKLPSGFFQRLKIFKFVPIVFSGNLEYTANPVWQ